MFVRSRDLGKRLFLALVQPMAQAQPETELAIGTRVPLRAGGGIRPKIQEAPSLAHGWRGVTGAKELARPQETHPAPDLTRLNPVSG